MAEITQDMTLGQALDFAENRALSLDQSAEAGRILTFKNAISAGKLGDQVTLDSPYLSTLKSEEFAKQITAKGKTKANYYTNAQALEKYVNQGFISQGLPDTNVIGATGTAKKTGVATGQPRGELPMRGMIPYAEIDRLYAEGFAEMGNKVDEATKDFLIYHRYTNHRVNTILTDSKKTALEDGKKVSKIQYKSLRLSDVSIFKDKDGSTVVTIPEAVRNKKKRYATTYTGSFAEFIKSVYDKAKTANPDKPNSDIKLFGTSYGKVSDAWDTYLKPKFVDQFESFLPLKANGEVATGLTQVVRSANIEALESDLKLDAALGDDYMGHTPTGTKAKSYKVNTPESKAIGNITENMVKTSALNLGTGTVNNLFSGYGLNTPTLDVSNEGVKVYDGHKSDFKFNEDALKEIVKPRVATAEEINLAKQTAITKTKAEQLQQIDFDIGIEKKQRELTQEKLKRVPLDQEALTKKIQEDETKKLLKKKLKEEGNLIPNPENTIPEEDVKKLKAQGLWDIITKGLKQIPIAGGLYAGMSQYAESAEAGDPTGVSIAKGALEVIPPVTPSDIKDVETAAKKGAESLVEKSMESGDSNVGFVEGLMGQFGYPSGGGFSSGGFINKNEIRR
jgi:hypothetical protein